MTFLIEMVYDNGLVAVIFIMENLIKGLYDGLEVFSVNTKKIEIKDYLKLIQKPLVLIENGIYFHLVDNLFILNDFFSINDENSFINYNDNYINIITNAIVIYPFKKKDDKKQDLYDIKENISTNINKNDIYTYVMLNKRNGYYKIGYSKCPSFREKTLQSEEPEIELLFKTQNNIEKYLHDIFNHKRIRGEWFNLTKDDIFFIKETIEANEIRI